MQNSSFFKKHIDFYSYDQLEEIVIDINYGKLY